MNLIRLCEKTGFKADEIADIILTFRETSQADLEEIRSGIEAKDAQRVVRAAHSIKGAALSLSLDDIAELAATIEKQGLSAQGRDALQIADRLAVAIREVSAMMGTLGSPGTGTIGAPDVLENHLPPGDAKHSGEGSRLG